MVGCMGGKEGGGRFAMTWHGPCRGWKGEAVDGAHAGRGGGVHVFCILF